MKTISALFLMLILHSVNANNVHLQKGAQAFMDYCAGCHNLKYVSSDRIKDDIGIPYILNKNNLNPIDAKAWFGVIPPDLSLKAREKGGKWLYQYFHGFYMDNTRPFGVNNYLVPNVAMPNVLAVLSNEQYEETLQNIVEFLIYTSEPAQLVRYSMGIWVLGYLLILLGLLGALKLLTDKFHIVK